jgi:hypothetical protein
MRLIIGLGYKAGVGKDTVANALVEAGFVKVGFADAVKAACGAVCGFNFRQLYVAGEKDRVDPFWGFSPRTAMQVMGSALRNNLAPDVWIRSLMRRIDTELQDKNIVICDVRYPNEAEAIKAAGGYVIRVERPGLVTAMSEAEQVHESEVSMNAYADWDGEVVNDGELKDVAPKAMAMLYKLPLVKASTFNECFMPK